MNPRTVLVIGARVLRSSPEVVGAALLTTFIVIDGVLTTPSLDAFAVGLQLIAGGSLAFCRLRPRTAIGVITVALGLYLGRGYGNGPILAAGWIGLLAASWWATRTAAIAGGLLLCGALAAGSWIADGGVSSVALVFSGWALAAVFLGEAARNRRRYLSELEERARQLEHSRDEESRRRIAEDRLRIARDLHDGVAHAMSTISIQAGAAAHVIERRPEAAKGALDEIQRASGDVLDELAAMLALLHADDERSGERRPTPGIGEIAALADVARRAGLTATLETEGAVDRVSRLVGTAAYRIVQESLTNVVRHAGATAVTVSLRARDGGFVTEVRDNGRGTADASVGSRIGIEGMRARTESTGGRLEAGPASPSGFLVRATWGGLG